jgi:hypothetical protein
MLNLSDYEDKLAGGGSFVLPGVNNGYPFVGDEIPNLKDGEADQLEYVNLYHTKAFDLSDPATKKEFEEIMGQIYNRQYVLIKKEYRWNDDKATPTVWLEWLETYNILPESK